MAEMNDDNHLFKDMTPESPGENIIRRLGLASWPSDFLIITQGPIGAEESV